MSELVEWKWGEYIDTEIIEEKERGSCVEEFAPAPRARQERESDRKWPPGLITFAVSD